VSNRSIPRARGKHKRPIVLEADSVDIGVVVVESEHAGARSDVPQFNRAVPAATEKTPRDFRQEGECSNVQCVAVIDLTTKHLD